MNINFVGDAYEARSKNINASRLINYYPETESRDSKSVLALIGAPGTVSRETLNVAQGVRGSFEYDGFAYFAAGNKLYKMTDSYISSEIGTLNTADGYVSMETNGLVLLIVDGTDGYTYTFSSEIFAVISDPQFPPNPDRCAVLDNTFIVIEGGSQRFWISTDGTTWDGGQFASAETAPDNLLSCIVDHQELLLGGVKTVEVWYNSGDATFTFSRRSTIETGVAGAAAMCKADNSVFFLGNDKVLWRLQGYTPVRVSNHAIEYAINQFTTVADCIMWTQKEEGHVFVWCQFPTGDRTFVYDVASNMWHERAWRDTNTGQLRRHRSNTYLEFNSKHLFGDFEDGRIYELSLDIYDDDGDPLPAIRVCGPLTSKDRQTAQRHDSLTVDIEGGVGLISGDYMTPQAMLKMSDDSGHSYGNEIYCPMGAIGEFQTQCSFGPLGSIRSPQARVYWFEITAPVKRIVIGADLMVS